jgi:hypothetical protein
MDLFENATCFEPDVQCLPQRKAASFGTHEIERTQTLVLEKKTCLRPIVFESDRTHDPRHVGKLHEQTMLVHEPPNGSLVSRSWNGHFNDPRITGRSVFHATNNSVRSLMKGFPERAIAQVRHDYPLRKEDDIKGRAVWKSRIRER